MYQRAEGVGDHRPSFIVRVLPPHLWAVSPFLFYTVIGGFILLKLKLFLSLELMLFYSLWLLLHRQIFLIHRHRVTFLLISALI